MSVTIVAPQPTASAASASESTTSKAGGATDAAATDFASLLLGQLAPQWPPVLADLRPPLDAPSTADGGEPAAAALLAALGLIAPHAAAKASESVADGDRLAADSGEPALGEAPSVLPAAALAAQPIAAPAAERSEARAALPSGASAAAVALAADDKPAKLAVTAPGLEPLAGASAAFETPGVSALAGHAQHAAARSAVGAPDASGRGSLALATPLRDQNWSADFGQKIVWLATSDKQSAQLTLNPPQMGPIEIAVNVEKGTATASFASASAEVRDAIETALPKLREMFANAGIELGQTNVGAESFRQQAQGGEASGGTSRWLADKAILGPDPAASPSREGSGQRGQGMVDIFA